MASILPGYEYDIFISYRQNDNKYDGWVTEFVDNLQKELDATLKTPVSIYFDENPHDGLQDSHVVDESLAKKLKCLIFIPIISQTYCDTGSFAWQHEFLAFNEIASGDELGMNITLANGNIASRILPIRIHDIDADDQQKFEGVTESPLRAIDFIYKEAGVNRSLKPTDDKKDNLNNTSYRNQMNKVAHAIKDLGISIIREGEGQSVTASTELMSSQNSKNRSSSIGIFFAFAAIIILALGYWGYTKFFHSSDIMVPITAELDKTIAVLPFSNTKPDPDTDFLGFAVANQIIGDLDYNKNVVVRPASSIRKYDKQVFDPQMVANDLKVNYLLTGTYLMQDDIIRLNIELLETNSESMIWRDNIEVDFHNAFELQDIVAKKVVEGLQTQFSQTELSRIGKNIPQNSLAYEYYLRGISYPLTIEGSQLAIQMLNQSIKLDSSFAPVYSNLGFRTQLIAQFNLQGPELALNAEKYYLEALSLNSDLLSAQADLAMLFVESGRIDQAIKLARNMVKINPNNATAHFSLAYIYRYGGMLAKSLEEADKAVDLDPQNPRFRRLGLTYLYVGEYNEASDILDLDKGSAYSLGWQADMFLRQGKTEEARIIFKKIISTPNENLWIKVAQFHHAQLNNNNELGSKILQELEDANLTDGEAWYFWATKHAMINNHSGAIRSLDRAVKSGYFNYPFMLTDQFMDTMRDDPEIQSILQQAKSKHEDFKVKYF